MTVTKNGETKKQYTSVEDSAIAPRILNNPQEIDVSELQTSATLSPEKAPHISLDMKRESFQKQCGHEGKEKISFPSPGIKPWFFYCSHCSVVMTLTNQRWFFFIMKSTFKFKKKTEGTLFLCV